MSERFTAPQDDALYLQMCAEIEEKLRRAAPLYTCLLYTSDAADE